MLTERTRIAWVIVLVVTWSVPSAARPQTVTIGEAVPFSATQLADAVALRAGDMALSIRVVRRGDMLEVEVGDATQAVVVDLADPHAAVRVVAMVVVALGTDGPALAPPGAAALVTPSVVLPATAPAPSPIYTRFAVRGMVGLWRYVDQDEVTPMTGAVAYRFAPRWRVAASVTSQARITHEPGRWLIWRAGVEALRGPFGLEGGVLTGRTEEGRTAPGAYVHARWYLRLRGGVSAVVEAGAHRVWPDPPQPHFPDEEYSAHLAGGLEWRL